jgi:hypothetical protein
MITQVENGFLVEDVSCGPMARGKTWVAVDAAALGDLIRILTQPEKDAR